MTVKNVTSALGVNFAGAGSNNIVYNGVLSLSNETIGHKISQFALEYVSVFKLLTQIQINNFNIF